MRIKWGPWPQKDHNSVRETKFVNCTGMKEKLSAKLCATYSCKSICNIELEISETQNIGGISKLNENRRNGISFSRAEGQPDIHNGIIKGGYNEGRYGVMMGKTIGIGKIMP